MAGFFLQLICDALSIITISSCLVLKVPQIMQLYKLKSAKGMNLKGLGLELFSYTTMFLYNYCHSYSILSYMEYPIILAQELVLIFLVLKYSDLLKNKQLQIGTMLYFAISILFALGFLPKSILMFLVPICTPISASSKVVFLYEILSTKNSDAVSLLTWFISAFTNATRIFTVFVESGDVNLLFNFGISTFLSSSILFAAWFFKQKSRVD